MNLPKVKDLPDYKKRKWIANNILGLDEPPELDPDALQRLNGLFSDLGPIDAVEIIKDVRERDYYKNYLRDEGKENET